MPNDDVDAGRFVRQMMLAEVGVEGQRAIERWEARVGGISLANEVAALYARGAGMARIAPRDIDTDEALVTSETARAVLAGSRAALAEIRSALGIQRSEPA